jgi:hypothetical protein
MALRVLSLPNRRPLVAPQPLAGQPFDFPTQLIGKTADGKVTVYADPAIGMKGVANAAALLAAAPALYAKCVAWFGMDGQPVNAIVAALQGATDGTDGAYHADCSFDPGGNLYIDAAFGNDAMVQGLFIAELTECFMGAQGKGWNCGDSPGESLSRAFASAVSGGSNGALKDFASAPSWISAGMPNWIDHNQGTDTDYPSIGCGMVYLSWMISLGYTLAQITQAGGSTLAENWAKLTGKTAALAWGAFTAAVAGVPSPTNDDPFGSAQPRPQPAPQPGPQPQPDPNPPNPQPSPAPSGGPTKEDARDAINTLWDFVKAAPDDPQP